MDVLIEILDNSNCGEILNVISSYQPIDWYIPFINHTFGKLWRFIGPQPMRNGLPHSYDDQPYHRFGEMYWYKNGLVHRENKPAVICGNYRGYYWNNKPHNSTGPALYFQNGTTSYYRYGVFIGFG